MNLRLFPLRVLNRRHCIALGLSAIFSGLSASYAATPPSRSATAHTSSTTIVVLGDSLSAEYGIKRGTGWVALLEKRLASEKPGTKLVNASISGDTTSGGRSRLPELLSLHKPAVLVIELGGNDALRGLPLDMTLDNLQTMTRAAQAAGAKVLLLGMQVPPNYGQDYGKRFADTFAQTAKANKAALVPFFLRGVADGPDALKLFQPDRIHPVEAAHPILLANVWPALVKLIP